MRLYFEAANFGKCVVWCDNWCVLVEAQDVGIALMEVYWKRKDQLLETDCDIEAWIYGDEAQALPTWETSK